MIYEVNSSNIQHFSEMMFAYFRLRHEVFVDKMGCEEFRSPLGLELDQYDNRNATYLIAVSGGQIVGSVRLISTEYPTFFNDAYKKLDDCDLSNSSQVYELSRFFCQGDLESRFSDGSLVLPSIMLAAIDFAIEKNMTHFVSVLEKAMADVFLAIELGVEKAGTSFNHGARYKAVPILCPIDSGFRQRVAKSFGLDRSLLTRELPEKPMSNLPDLAILSSINAFSKGVGVGRQLYIRRVLEEMEAGTTMPDDQLSDLCHQALMFSQRGREPQFRNWTT